MRAGSFGRYVALLVSGNAIAEGVAIGASLVLSRLYPPAAFGLFASYSATAVLLSTVFTGNYEPGIALPKSHEEGRQVFRLAIALAAACMVVVQLTMLAGGTQLVHMVSDSMPLWIAHLLPISSLIMVTIASQNFWHIRHRQFRSLTTGKLIMALSSATLQIGMAFTPLAGPLGLIGGQLVAQLGSCLYLFRTNGPEARAATRTPISYTVLRDVARRYVDFPRFMLIASVVNKVTTYLPVYALTAMSPEAVGLFALAQRVIRSPMSVIGGSVADVYFRKSIELRERSPHALSKNTRRMVLSMVGLATIPTLVLLLAGPTLFALVFGAAWREAGRYSQVMSIYLLMQFAFSPLCRLFSALERQGLYNVWEWVRLALTAAGVSYGVVIGDAYTAVVGFSIAMCLSYLVLGAMSWKILRDDMVRHEKTRSDDK